MDPARHEPFLSRRPDPMAFASDKKTFSPNRNQCWRRFFRAGLWQSLAKKPDGSRIQGRHNSTRRTRIRQPATPIQKPGQDAHNALHAERFREIPNERKSLADLSL